MLCTSGFIDVVTYSHRGLYNGMSLPLQPMFFFWICWLQQRRCDVIHRLTPLLRVTGCLVSYATADIETRLLCRAGGAGDWIYNGCTIQPISNLHPAVKRITWSMHHEGLSMWRSEKASSARYRRGTARCVVSVEILPIATQQCINYLYDKSWTKYHTVANWPARQNRAVDSAWRSVR